MLLRAAAGVGLPRESPSGAGATAPPGAPGCGTWSGADPVMGGLSATEGKLFLLLLHLGACAKASRACGSG